MSKAKKIAQFVAEINEVLGKDVLNSQDVKKVVYKKDGSPSKVVLEGDIVPYIFAGKLAGDDVKEIFKKYNLIYPILVEEVEAEVVEATQNKNNVKSKKDTAIAKSDVRNVLKALNCSNNSTAKYLFRKPKRNVGIIV